MELNILIEGDAQRAKVAEALAMRLSDKRMLEIDMTENRTASMVIQVLTRKVRKPDVLLFKDIDTPETLLMCVIALKEYRPTVRFDVTAVFVCAPAVIVLADRAHSPLIMKASCDATALRDFREAFEGMQGAGAMVVRDAEFARVEYLGVDFKLDGPIEDAPPLMYGTWDEGTDAHVAATLMDGNVPVCEARNVMTYHPTVGRSVIFEAGDPLPSGFVPCLVKCNSQYLRNGTFEHKAFTPERVRPATENEVCEYLKLKFTTQY